MNQQQKPTKPIPEFYIGELVTINPERTYLEGAGKQTLITGIVYTHTDDMILLNYKISSCDSVHGCYLIPSEIIPFHHEDMEVYA